jgi:hypothetical protein
METLLNHHYEGKLSFETEDLRLLAESIDKDHVRRQEEQALAQESDESESEDDTFITVQPLGDNITRMYLHRLTTMSPLFDITNMTAMMTDYSGEYSHWNFSMRLKQWIERCAPIPRYDHVRRPIFCFSSHLRR